MQQTLLIKMYMRSLLLMVGGLLLALPVWASFAINVIEEGGALVRPVFPEGVQLVQEDMVVTLDRDLNFARVQLLIEVQSDSAKAIPFLMKFSHWVGDFKLEMSESKYGGTYYRFSPRSAQYLPSKGYRFSPWRNMILGLRNAMARLDSGSFEGYDQFLEVVYPDGIPHKTTPELKTADYTSFFWYPATPMKPGTNYVRISFLTRLDAYSGSWVKEYEFDYEALIPQEVDNRLEDAKFRLTLYGFGMDAPEASGLGSPKWQRGNTATCWERDLGQPGQLSIRIRPEIPVLADWLIQTRVERVAGIFGLLLVLLHFFFMARSVRFGSTKRSKRIWKWGSFVVPVAFFLFWLFLYVLVDFLLGDHAHSNDLRWLLLILALVVTPVYLLPTSLFYGFSEGLANNRMKTLKHKLLGSWYGFAIGDGFGAPTEFMHLPDIEAKWGTGGVKEPPTGVIRVTDDTQMALAVGRALQDSYRDDTVPFSAFEKALTKEFIDWLNDPENNRAPGNTCLAACENLERGQDFLEATVRNSKGCGANMRVTPVGLLKFKPRTRVTDLEVGQLAQLQAAFTHGHATGLAASELTAIAVVKLIEGVAPGDLVDFLLEHSRKQRQIYHGGILKSLWQRPGIISPIDFIERGWDDCIGILERVKDAVENGDPTQDPCDYTGEGWIAEEAFGTALVSFLWFPDDFSAVMIRAANTRGDSDSIACLAGAFSGAWLGEESIPEDWKARIEYADELSQYLDFLTS